MSAVYHAEIPVDLAMPSRQRLGPCQFFYGDSRSHIFTALVADRSDPEAGIRAGTVTGAVLRQDGVTVALDGVKGEETVQVTFPDGVTASATPCSVTLTQECFAVLGPITVTIKLTDGSGITSVLSVTGNVIRAETDEIVDPGQVIPDLVMIRQAVEDANDAADNANDAADNANAAAQHAVRYDEAQELTDEQKTQALSNAGAAGVAESSPDWLYKAIFGDDSDWTASPASQTYSGVTLKKTGRRFTLNGAGSDGGSTLFWYTLTGTEHRAFTGGGENYSAVLENIAEYGDRDFVDIWPNLSAINTTSIPTIAGVNLRMNFTRKNTSDARNAVCLALVFRKPGAEAGTYAYSGVIMLTALSSFRLSVSDILNGSRQYIVTNNSLWTEYDQVAVYLHKPGQYAKGTLILEPFLYSEPENAFIGAVRYNQAQNLSASERSRARSNIGASSADQTETALTQAEAALTLKESEAVGVVAGGSGPIYFLDGEEHSGTTSAHTDYIDISSYDAIIYSRVMSTTDQASISAGLAFYDSEKTYITGMPNHGGQTEQGYELFELPVPVGANYVRFTYYASSSLTDLTLRGVYKLYAKTADAVNTRKETHNYNRWSQGTLDNITGANATSSATCRTSAYVMFPSAENGMVTIHIADGYRIRVFEFDENQAFVRRYLSNRAGPAIDVRVDRSHWYRLTIAKADGSTLAPGDVPEDAVWWEYQTSERYRDAEAPVTNAYPWWVFTVTINRAWPNTETTTSDNAETVDSHDVNCALVLPTTYTASGSPTPLVMFGHGLGSSLSKDSWYGNNSNFLKLIRALRAAGYAVFDVDSSRGGSGGFADWGSLPLMESYIAAWDYIREHYNVSEKLFIFSDSMGTAASLNMLKWYPGRIATAVQTAPRPFSGPERYATDDDDDKKEILVAYGMEPDSILDDPTYVIPDVSVFDGLFSGFRNGTIAIGGVQYVPHQFPPIKVMVGQEDTTLLDETRTYYAALANSGNYVNYREVAGANHSVMCFLSQGDLTQEAINWLNRFRT